MINKFHGYKMQNIDKTNNFIFQATMQIPLLNVRLFTFVQMMVQEDS